MRLRTALYILSVATIAYGEPVQTPRNIQNMRTDEALSLLTSYRTEREAAIRSLRDFFADKADVTKRSDVLVEVLNTAGSLRANEVVSNIVDIISFVPPESVFRPNVPPDDYPAVKALIQIGFPAVQAALERAQGEQDKFVLSLYAIVVKGVLGQEAGTNYVALMAKKSKNLIAFQSRYFPTE
jgi:hypothetical protein